MKAPWYKDRFYWGCAFYVGYLFGLYWWFK